MIVVTAWQRAWERDGDREYEWQPAWEGDGDGRELRAQRTDKQNAGLSGYVCASSAERRAAERLLNDALERSKQKQEQQK